MDAEIPQDVQAFNIELGRAILGAPRVNKGSVHSDSACIREAMAWCAANRERLESLGGIIDVAVTSDNPHGSLLEGLHQDVWAYLFLGSVQPHYFAEFFMQGVAQDIGPLCEFAHLFGEIVEQAKG